VGGDFGGYDGFDQRHLVKLLPETSTRPGTFRLTYDKVTTDETNTWVSIEVWRRGDASGPAGVSLRTEDGTATEGEDFVPVDIRLDFGPGEWSKTVIVTILDDQLVENVEQLTLRLSNPTEGFELVRPWTMTVEIRSEDAGVEFVEDEFRGVEEEGFTQAAVRWHGAVSAGLQVRVNLVPVTGEGADLGVSSLLITYANRSTNWFRIPMVDDAHPEGVEEFRLELAGAAPVVPGPRSTATLFIEDHDFETTPGRGVAGVVEAIASAPEGGVYLVGEFTGVHGVPRNGLARLLPDGEVDLDTNSFNVDVLDRAIVGRLMPDGNWDSSFSWLSCALPPVPAASYFFSDEFGSNGWSGHGPLPTAWLASQPDGVLVLAGAFYTVNDEPRRRLARLKPDGMLRGRLNLNLTGGNPTRLSVPGDVEVPYVLETSLDLEHWSGWLHNDYPWWPVDLWIWAEEPARFFRARPVQ
jgi:hypothetical protein